VPPALLRSLVSGTEDLDWFLRSGKLLAENLSDTLAGHGLSLGQFGRVLDFGCGCGRVLRHLKGLVAGELHGTDCNRAAVRWCRGHLPFVEAAANGLEPPLSYPDGTFDLVYSFSVFTHLPEPLQRPWMDELRRVLAPGGHLLVSVHGERFADHLPPQDRPRFERGELTAIRSDLAGANECCAFHPDAYVRGVLAEGFDVVGHVPSRPDGGPLQDLYLMRRHDAPVPQRRRAVTV
jgi:SAM-dependent methyltransferase